MSHDILYQCSMYENENEYFIIITHQNLMPNVPYFLLRVSPMPDHKWYFYILLTKHFVPTIPQMPLLLRTSCDLSPVFFYTRVINRRLYPSKIIVVEDMECSSNWHSHTCTIRTVPFRHFPPRFFSRPSSA